MPAFLAAPAATDARIEEIRIGFEDFRYRAPYKFGGKEVDRVTMLNVHCRLALKSGKSAEGFAAMSMGNVWSFPAPDIPYDTTLGAMKTLAEKIAGITRGFTEYAHPLDVNFALEPEYLKAAAQTSREMRLPRPIPKLCTLVTASPVDAAIHDAFGRLHDRNAFTACGRDFVRYDLEHYLGRAEFHGEFLDPYILPKAVPRVRMYHSAGASDPLTAAEIRKPIRDGLPETLEDWIPYSGITAIKIKLNGNDLAWDVDRVAGIHAVATAAQAKRGVREWIYSLDFNERCPNVQYLLDFEHRLKSQIAHRVRPGAIHRAAHRARSGGRPREHDVRSRQAAARGHRRIAHRARYAAAGARDGVHRRGSQGLQGTVAHAPAGGRRAEVQDVPLRAGPHLSRRRAGAFGGDRRPRAGRGDRGGQRARVRARGQQGLGEALPRHLQCKERIHGHRRPGWPRPVHRSTRMNRRTLRSHRRHRPSAPAAVFGANDRVRMGLIGSGGRGRQDWTTFLKQPDIEPVAVCDVYGPFLEKGIAMTGGRAKAYKDFRTLLEQKDIDAVIVATPDHWHALITIAACQAGKDVYCEKPLSLTVTDGRKMLDAARQHNRVVQTGSQQRSGTHYAAAVKLIQDGGIGAVHRIHAGMQRNIYPGLKPTEMASGISPDFNYEMWLGPAPARPFDPFRCIYNFRWFWDYSGGQMTNWGAHHLDIARWIAGAEAPEEVAGFGGRYALTDGGETPDIQQVTYQFPKMVVNWTTSEIGQGKGFTLDIYGTKGMMTLTRGGYQVTPEKLRQGQNPRHGAARDERQRPGHGARPQLP